MIKKIALLVVIAFCMGFISSCGENNIEENGAKTGQSIDLEGYDSIILQDRDEVAPFWYEADTSLADDALAHIKQTEENLNCKITLKRVPSAVLVAEVANAIITSLAATSPMGDIFFGDSYSSFLMAKAGALTPLSEVKDFMDYEDAAKFGSANIQELTMLEGVPYTVVPVQWPEMLPNMRDVIITNNNIIVNQLLQSDPREYVEKGEWNPKTFEELVKVSTIKEDGKTSVYGFTGSLQYFIELSIFNSDVSYLVKKDDGGYVSELFSDKAINALSWAQDVVSRNSDSFLFYPDSPRTVTDTFIQGNASMLLMSTWWLFLYIVYDVDNFAILPFPKMTESAESGWVSSYQSNLTAGIVLNSDLPDYSAQIISDLFRPFASYPDNQSIKDYYVNQVFHDKRDVDVLFKLADNVRYNYNYVDGEDMFSNIATNFSRRSAAEHLSRYADQLQPIIDDFIEPNYDYMSSH